MEHKFDGDTSCSLCTWIDSQRLIKGSGRTGNWRSSRDRRNYSNVKINQNTEKSPGYLGRLAVNPDFSERLSVKSGVKNSQGVIQR